MTKKLSKIIDIDSALKILNNLKIENLEPEQIKKLFEKAAEQKAIHDILYEAKISTVNIEKEISDFLNTRKSNYTAVTYKNCIDKWKLYCKENRIDIRVPSTKDADIYAAVCREKMCSSTANANINAISSFYKFIQKHHNIVSPFIMIRRANDRGKKKLIPSLEEIEIIKLHIPKRYWQAIDVMYLRGFRIGALKNLHVYKDNTFLTFSKGKKWSGKIPDNIIFDSEYPFKNIPSGSIQMAVARACSKLYESGKISHKYSVQDFRHFFACTEYKKDKDINRVMILLNHADIGMTQVYLRGLNILQ